MYQRSIVSSSFKLSVVAPSMNSSTSMLIFFHICRAASSTSGAFQISYCLPSTPKLLSRSPGGFQSFDVALGSSVAGGSGRCLRNSSGERSTWLISGMSLSSNFSSNWIFSFGFRSFARKSSSICGFL